MQKVCCASARVTIKSQRAYFSFTGIIEFLFNHVKGKKHY